MGCLRLDARLFDRIIEYSGLKMIKFAFNRPRHIPALAFYVGVFIVFLVTGICGGRSIGSGDYAESTDTPRANNSGEIPATIALPTTGQRNLLVVGVDNLTAAHPQLEGAWLVMYFQGKPDITLLPVNPQPTEMSNRPSTGLNTNFSLDENGIPSHDFLEKLNHQVWWNNYIVIDKTGLIGLINLVGGMQVGNQHLTGAQVLAKMTSSWEDSGSAYVGQARLLSHLCEQARSSSFSLEQIAAMLKQIDTHLATDLDIIKDLDTWLNKSNNSFSLSCEFPLLSSSVP